MAQKSLSEYIELYGKPLVLKWVERGELEMKRRKAKQKRPAKSTEANQKLKNLDAAAYRDLLKRLGRA